MDIGNTQFKRYFGQIDAAQIIGFKCHLRTTVDRSKGSIDDESRMVIPEILFNIVVYSQTQFFATGGKKLCILGCFLVEMSQCTADQT